MVTRTRVQDARVFTVHSNAFPEQDTVRTLTLHRLQRTESEGHPFSRLGKTNEDIGGDFKSTIRYFPSPGGYFDLAVENGGSWYKGPIWTSRPSTYENPTLRESEWERYTPAASADLLDQRGATAVSRTIPTNPTFSAAAAIGELREGLPSIPGKSVLRAGVRPKGTADEFLNFQFGILPTVSDAKKLLEAHKNSEKILAQLYRDSGRLVRRRMSFPSEVTEETTTATGVYPWGPGRLVTSNTSSGTRVTTTRTERKFWFSGGYTYLFPKQEGWHRKIAELEKVYGVIPDAADLWQLTPWSWAVDWVSNAGDLIQNMTSFSQDNLVMRHGYIMCKTTQVVTETWQGSFNFHGVWSPVELRCTSKTVVKQRKRATPYGFGLDAGKFSTRQKAIIAALGISRGSR